MHIKELFISDFGKFKDYRISLSSGLNVIYGQNEAGKSTVQAFIKAMLYGFFKQDSAKKRMYLEDYDKYLPWMNKTAFGGQLIMSEGKREYRIIRSFLKRHEDIKIYDEAGADITGKFKYNEILRIYDPAHNLLGISATAFNNTLCIAQMGCRTDKQLGVEVNEQIVSMSQTADSELSIKKAVKELNDRENSIGTIRRMSPMKDAYELINRLEQKLRDARERERTFFELKSKRIAIERGIAALERERTVMSEQISQIKAGDTERNYNRVKKALTQLLAMQLETIALSRYKGIDPGELLALQEYGISRRERLTALERQRQEFLRSKAICDGLEIELQFSVSQSDYGFFQNFNRYRDKYETLKRERQEYDGLLSTYHPRSQEIKTLSYIDLSGAKADLAALRAPAQRKKMTTKSKLMLTAALILVAGGAALIPLVHWYCFVLCLVGAYFAYSELKVIAESKEAAKKYETRKIFAKYRALNIFDQEGIERYIQAGDINNFKYDNVQNELDILSARIKEKAMFINELAREVKDYLTSLRGSGEMSDAIFDEISAKAGDAGHKISTLEKEKTNLTQLDASIRDMEAQISADEARMIALREKYATDDYKQLEELKQRGLQLVGLHRRMAAQKLMIQDLLGGKSAFELEKHMMFAEAGSVIPTASMEDLEDRLDKAVEQQNELKQRREGICVLMDQEINKGSTVGEIELLMENARNAYDALALKAGAIALSKQKINEIAAVMHREFAPVLNRSISEMVSTSTRGKYQALYIDRDMNILVEEPQMHTPISIESLSSGTIDLVYIAARIALIDFIKKDNRLPIILDDSLVQLDDNRMGQVLRLLADQSKVRQIILFNCTNREMQQLGDMGIEYNKIFL